MEAGVITEVKPYNSELRALFSIRNFSKVMEQHFSQMLKIELELKNLYRNALSIIENHCLIEQQKKWKESLQEVNASISEINNILKTAKEKVVNKDSSVSTVLWDNFDLNIKNLKTAYKKSENIGYEILPESEHVNWKNSICNFGNTILPLILCHANSCKVELQLIEKYTPKEFDKITQIIFDHIPENFTFEEADKYEEDYHTALVNFKKEFKQEKNLWDKFLDVLAGGTHQPPSERVMMSRWLEGEKRDL